MRALRAAAATLLTCQGRTQPRRQARGKRRGTSTPLHDLRHVSRRPQGNLRRSLALAQKLLRNHRLQKMGQQQDIRAPGSCRTVVNLPRLRATVRIEGHSSATRHAALSCQEAVKLFSQSGKLAAPSSLELGSTSNTKSCIAKPGWIFVLTSRASTRTTSRDAERTVDNLNRENAATLGKMHVAHLFCKNTHGHGTRRVSKC